MINKIETCFDAGQFLQLMDDRLSSVSVRHILASLFSQADQHEATIAINEILLPLQNKRFPQKPLINVPNFLLHFAPEVYQNVTDPNLAAYLSVYAIYRELQGPHHHELHGPRQALAFPCGLALNAICNTDERVQQGIVCFLDCAAKLYTTPKTNDVHINITNEQTIQLTSCVAKSIWAGHDAKSLNPDMDIEELQWWKDSVLHGGVTWSNMSEPLHELSRESSELMSRIASTIEGDQSKV